MAAASRELASLLTARPSCPKCGTRTMLVRIFPDRPGYDVRTYECPRCEHEVIEVVQSKKAS